MAVKYNEEQIAALMRLGNTREEAVEALEYDRQVDAAGAKDVLEYDLTPEQAKEVKKYINAAGKTAVTPNKPKAEKPKRERKANATKGAIISELATFLAENSENATENVQILNAERVISFQVGENTYELTLTQKRKPKT